MKFTAFTLFLHSSLRKNESTNKTEIECNGFYTFTGWVLRYKRRSSLSFIQSQMQKKRKRMIHWSWCSYIMQFYEQTMFNKSKNGLHFGAYKGIVLHVSNFNLIAFAEEGGEKKKMIFAIFISFNAVFFLAATNYICILLGQYAMWSMPKCCLILIY